MTATQTPPTDTPEPAAALELVEEPEDDQILDLVSIAPLRRPVRVPTKSHPEGETFPLRLMDDFGIEQQQQLMSWGRRYDALFNKEDDLSPDEAVKLKHYLDCIFDQVLDAPKAVKKSMPDAVRQRVVTAFTLAPLLARQEADRKAALAEESQQTSESSSPDSSGSTEETPRSGSRSP